MPEKIVTLPKIKTVEAGCPTCGGHGHHGESDNPKDNPFCPDCKGRGKISIAESAVGKCLACNGKGMEGFSACFPCAGTGKVKADAPVQVQTPEPGATIVELLQVENNLLQDKCNRFAADIEAGSKALDEAKATIKDLRKQLREGAKAANSETAAPAAS